MKPAGAWVGKRRTKVLAGTLIAVSALFATVSCGSISDPPSPAADKTGEVLETAFRNIDNRYATDVSIERVSLDGLKAVLGAAPMMDLSKQGRVLVLSYNDTDLGEWAMPPAHDYRAWSVVAAQIMRIGRSQSQVLEETDRERMLAAFFRGGLAGLDRYTRYETPQQTQNTRARREGFGGLGIAIRYENGRTFVSKVHHGTPAFKAGLKADDLITHVGDIALAGLGQDGVVERLRGPVHSTADLTVIREQAPRPLRISVVRAHIILPTVEVSREKDILVVKISGFNQGTSRSLGRELAIAERDAGGSLKGVILDLRSNPGGLLDQAVTVSDFFLNDGRIISTRGRHRRANQIFDASWGERLRNLPIALLVNGRSASASEIVAAALRDRGRAVLVGTSSFGKGSVQTIIRLPNGGELTLTWAHMIAPSGFNLQGHGVIPAICTSGAGTRLSALVDAVRRRTANPDAVFGGVLALRHAVRTDPEKARADCPPSAKERDEDLEIARYILRNKRFYTRALADGGPAIAERK